MDHLKLRTAVNGFILTEVTTDDEGHPLENEIVFDSDGGRLSESKAVQELLYNIMERLGYFTSKHESHNIRIIIEDRDGKEVYE